MQYASCYGLRRVKTRRNDLCRLCHAPSELCISHVFPRSFIKLTRDEDSNKFHELHDGADKLVQDGPKEKLLCVKCEQRISRYEKYFKEALHLSRHRIEILQNGREAAVRGLDYDRTKLFLLSVLWRMSISSLPQCQAVSLSETEEIIRRMILEGRPGGSQEFPVCACIPLIGGRMDERWLCTPFVSARGAVYALIIGGILYFISIANGRVLPDPMCLLSESGDWVMPIVDFDKVPFLYEFIAHHFQGERSADGQPEKGV